MIIKEQLIEKINEAFKGIKLEEGIGLWETQGLDAYATREVCEKLREQDEKTDWQKIPLVNLYKCSSSLSFFDAKGIRFHLPLFLLFDLDVFEKEEAMLYEKGMLDAYICPEVLFTLTYKLESDYAIKRFSRLNNNQIKCVIAYLYFQIQGKEPKDLSGKLKNKRNEFHKQITDAINLWKVKLKKREN